MFWIKKFIAAFLYPLPVCLLLLLTGVILLWFTGKQRLGKIITTTALGLLLLFSYAPLPHGVVRSLERTYAVYEPARHAGREVKWVVVLSGGVSDDEALPPNDQLSGQALARLIEGIRLVREYPDARLLVSGGKVYSTVAEATVMKRVSTMLGVEPGRVVVEDASRDTEDQARNVREIVGEEPFILVTSAVHMPRSMALFQKQGLHPLPAPTAHFIKGRQRLTLGHFFPSSGTIYTLKVGWHEVMGLWWARLRGRA